MGGTESGSRTLVCLFVGEARIRCLRRNSSVVRAHGVAVGAHQLALRNLGQDLFAREVPLRHARQLEAFDRSRSMVPLHRRVVEHVPAVRARSTLFEADAPRAEFSAAPLLTLEPGHSVRTCRTVLAIPRRGDRNRTCVVVFPKHVPGPLGYASMYRRSGGTRTPTRWRVWAAPAPWVAAVVARCEGIEPVSARLWRPAA